MKVGRFEHCSFHPVENNCHLQNSSGQDCCAAGLSSFLSNLWHQGNILEVAFPNRIACQPMHGETTLHWWTVRATRHSRCAQPVLTARHDQACMSFLPCNKILWMYLPHCIFLHCNWMKTLPHSSDLKILHDRAPQALLHCYTQCQSPCSRMSMLPWIMCFFSSFRHHHLHATVPALPAVTPKSSFGPPEVLQHLLYWGNWNWIQAPKCEKMWK